MKMRATTVLFAVLGLAIASGASAATADPVIRKQLDSLKLKYEVDSDGDYKIVMDVGNGRTQLAYIRSNTETYGSNQVREIWSPGYKSSSEVLPERVANRLLEYSHTVKLGGWVKQKGGYAVFVVKLPTSAGADALKDALDAAVSSADEIEQEFTGKQDEF
jgi:hypothetical protein